MKESSFDGLDNHHGERLNGVDQEQAMQLLIVTGMSGAGKSVVLRALEDMGFFCVDNLPTSLITPLFQLHASSSELNKHIGLGIDVRGGASAQEIIQQLDAINTMGSHSAKIFFLTASDGVLIKRFQETRRRHPLADGIGVNEAIKKERDMLRWLADKADIHLATDQLTIHQLRQLVRELFGNTERRRLLVSLVSFGFKYGLPPESNFVFDVRSLPNPYFVPQLCEFDGTSLEIENYLFSQPEVIEYWDKMVDFFRFAIKKAFDEGRSFVSVAVGCTGGRHRSVALVQKLAKEAIPSAHCLIKHRDIDHI